MSRLVADMLWSIFLALYPVTPDVTKFATTPLVLIFGELSRKGYTEHTPGVSGNWYGVRLSILQ